MIDNDQFQTFGKFEKKEDALKLADLFDKNNISYEIEDLEFNFDQLFSSNKVNNEYRVKIQLQNFEKADALVVASANDDAIGIHQSENQHYLYDFTDTELIDIVTKSDEWSKQDYTLALSILKERGKEISEVEIASLKNKRIEDLSKPENHNTLWIYIGYLSALAGGLFGIVIGWHLISSKKKLPNGDHLYNFSPAGRKHGRIMLLLGFIILIYVITKHILTDL
jgi:hypothetical protein